MDAVVLERIAGVYKLWLEDDVREASLRGRFKKDTGGTVVPGDRVKVAEQSDGALTIESVYPRTSMLQRRSPGRKHGVRIVAANIDKVIVVGSAADPPWDPMLIDRFLCIAEANGLDIELTVNKCDLVESTEPYASPYREIGYVVHEVSAASGKGMETLMHAVRGVTALFTGSSGVGKSSLLNAIEPGLALRTGAISQKSRGGRHTTVASVMCPVRHGGFVVDTPGLRDVSVWALSGEEVEGAFPEIQRAAEGCRFDDCRHDSEPDCAVKAAVESGTIAATRLASFRALVDEARAASRFWE